MWIVPIVVSILGCRCLAYHAFLTLPWLLIFLVIPYLLIISIWLTLMYMHLVL